MSAECPICKKVLRDAAGLSGHMRLSHPSAVPVEGAGIEQLRQEVAQLRQLIGINAKDFEMEEGMEGHKYLVIDQKDLEIDRLRGELKQAQQAQNDQLNAAHQQVREVFSHLDGQCSDPASCDLNRRLAAFRRKTMTVKDVSDWLKERRAIGVVDGQLVTSIEIQTSDKE